MELFWRPRDFLGVPYDNHIGVFIGEPSVLMAQEKRKEEQLTGCLMNNFTLWALVRTG